VLAADGATKRDCTALVGCTWNAEKRRVEVVYCRVWRPDNGQPLSLTETVGPEIVRLQQTYKVAGVYYDPFQMQAIAELCRKAGVVMVEFPQTSRRVQSDTYLHQLLWGGNLAHYGDPVLREHVTSALTKQSERGQRIVKELTTSKVDGAVALAMAALGANELLTQGLGYMTTRENPFYG
jgi:phage terminase large subunit-like protein